MKKFKQSGFTLSIIVMMFVAIFVVLGVGYIVYTHAIGQAVASPSGINSTDSLVASNCIPVWVSGNQMIFNSADSNHVWRAYIGNTNCQNGTLLDPSAPGNVGASGVTPDGRYVVLEVAIGNLAKYSFDQPGKGTQNQLFLLDRQTGRLTQLTSGELGSIWASINSTGTMVTWSQMIETPGQLGNIFNQPFGAWQIDVANITPQGTLTNQRSYSAPGAKGFYETYGFYGNNILFASDVGVPGPYFLNEAWQGTQDWTINDSLSPGTQPVMLTHAYVSPSGKSTYMYHEFMHVAPPGTFGNTGPWILGSMSISGSTGIDLWRMSPDGSNESRVSYFNGFLSLTGLKAVQGYPTPKFSIVGQIAIDPNNPTVIYASVENSASSNSWNMWKIQVQ